MHVNIDESGKHPAALSINLLIDFLAHFLLGFLQLHELLAADQHTFFFKGLRIAVVNTGIANSDCIHRRFLLSS